LNPAWTAIDGLIRPDGDVELGDYDYQRFVIAGCPTCDGPLKPDVVFFGERVPPERHAQANTAIAEAALLLVVGSSLMVNSGYRLVRTAEQHEVPIVVFNRGLTRADAAASLKFEGNAGALLSELAARLSMA
jgi:NAD-dependent SIR2 family protein deacetylase